MPAMPATVTPCDTPTGLPPTRGPALRDYKKVTFYLEASLWERLARLARDEFRRVDDQAGYLVRRALVGSEPTPPWLTRARPPPGRA
jgi:hypothetical protein